MQLQFICIKKKYRMVCCLETKSAISPNCELHYECEVNDYAKMN